jgi:hypothetical protein
MKKHLFFTLCLVFVSFIAFAGKFVLIPVNVTNNLETLFNNNDLKIHYYTENYVLATTDNLTFNDMVVLDEHAFRDVDNYAIVYCFEEQKEEYLTSIAGSVKTLYSGTNFFVMKLVGQGFMPAKGDGMITITDTEARLPKTRFDYPIITEPDDNILACITQVNTEGTMAYIQTMEDFVTRRCNHPNSILAQNWLKEQFESFGLNTNIHNVTGVYPWWGGGNVQSGNVIAVQKGTEFPDEYIVCGGHYDSFVFSYDYIEPGADDDASGVAGVLETARILSQYEFKRSIIYCAFTAEECGLDGSGQYAQSCVNQGMDILGYFNLDMTGYLRPGDPIHFCLIFPNSAQPLANYFLNVSNIYFPQVPVTTHTSLPWGDSDHTSFNQKGYKGIWWFEDIEFDSPYIHTANDKIGLSVNNPEQVSVFTQALVASVATLAIFEGEIPPLNPPFGCVAENTQGLEIKITWNAPEVGTPDSYNIYRNDVKIAQTEELFFVDLTVDNFAEHCYQVSAVYGTNESEQSNESCVTIPAFPPTNCKAKFYEDMSIKVTWDAPTYEVTPKEYRVYRDEKEIAQQEELILIDAVEDYIDHCYTIKAIYESAESVLSNESCASGLHIIENNSNFEIFPNPTTGELRIMNYELRNGSLSEVEVEIFDVYGRKLFTNHYSLFTNDGVVINLSHLYAGIYFLTITSEKGTDTIKVVKH